MNLRRIAAFSRPIADRIARPQSQPLPHAPHRTEVLAHWLAETEEDGAYSADRLWRLFQTHRFASLWYGAREAGEHLRAWALSDLYGSRSLPGGPHPDPREPAAFSNRAVLGKAAELLSVRIWIAPDVSDTPNHIEHAYQATQHTKQQPDSRPIQLASIITYPDHRTPDISTSPTTSYALQEFSIACALGYLTRERERLMDPDAPKGITALPQDLGVVTILHQFAIALMALPKDCPDDWTCACNTIRARYNAAPPDHDQPTDTFSLSALNDLRRRVQEKQQPPKKGQPHKTQPPGNKINSGPLT